MPMGKESHNHPKRQPGVGEGYAAYLRGGPRRSVLHHGAVHSAIVHQRDVLWAQAIMELSWLRQTASLHPLAS